MLRIITIPAAQKRINGQTATAIPIQITAVAGAILTKTITAILTTITILNHLIIIITGTTATLILIPMAIVMAIAAELR